MTVYFARKEYIYSGGDAIFSIPFSYIKKEHISVLVNDETTENYTYLNNSQIQVNDTLKTNDVVSIIRSTPIDSRMVVFSDTSILDKKAQNLAQEQVFDAIQEVYDNNIKFNIDTLDILEANKEELKQIIADNKQEVLDIQADFKQEVNTTIETVTEAAEKINNLEQAVGEAKAAAQTATTKADETQEVLVNAVTEMDSRLNSATATMNEKLSAANTAVENATQQANLAAQKAQEIVDINPANTNLSNITETGETNIKRISQEELNNPYSLFDSKYSDHELNNLSWLKSEGQWNAKAVYPSAYDKLLKVYNGTETVEGLSVKLSTETYTDYDFVLNTTDETFRLPLKTKLKFYDEVAPVVGNGMSLGLTNGTGYGGLNTGGNIGQMSAHIGTYGKPVGSPGAITNSLINTSLGVTTDPTKSGIQTHLTEATLYLYFYVGETVQNANLIDAGRIGEQLATKASVNDIDGAFVESVLALVDGTTYTVGTTYDTKTLVQFDISNYLPEDSNEYDYEVRLNSEGYATNTSIILWINIPSVADMSHAWSDQVNTSCSTVGSVVTQIIPKGYKKASIYLRSSSSSMQLYSHIVGYRRLRKGA